jgi:hypothetical protein
MEDSYVQDVQDTLKCKVSVVGTPVLHQRFFRERKTYQEGVNIETSYKNSRNKMYEMVCVN